MPVMPPPISRAARMKPPIAQVGNEPPPVGVEAAAGTGWVRFGFRLGAVVVVVAADVEA